MTANTLQTSDARQRFTYSRLTEPTKQIRLAQIRPSHNEHSAIQLVIKHVNLGDYGEARFLEQQEEWERRKRPLREPECAPRFVLDKEPENVAIPPEFRALSYAWGTVASVHDVYVESQDGQGWFSVRENLHEFLINWRHETRPPAWLWIDQICINQEDETEKGRQVNLMSEIYVRAAEVITWLGPAFEGSDEAMDFIGDIARAYKDLHTVALCEAPQGVKCHLQALIAIGKAPYWSRLWIVQEVVLGGDQVLVHLGAKVLNYTTEVKPAFRRVIDDCLYRPDDVPGYSLIPEWWNGSHYGRTPSWWHIYDLAVKQECHDERDKAFGMLGLVHPDFQFHPDYSMTSKDVLFTIIRAENRVEIHGWPDVETTALKWLSIFDKHHNIIDVKAVRRLLRKEVHSASRRVKQDYWRKHRTLSLQGFFEDWKSRCWDTPYDEYVGSGPAWLAQIRLRWMFPNTNSRRWRSKWLHRTGYYVNDLY
jgi:hypothetical protein